MPEKHRPRKGSMGYSPRRRAVSEVPRFSSWPEGADQPQLQAFAGYKAGMTNVLVVNDVAESPREGMEESVAATVLEVPPMAVVAVRAYEDTAYGLQPITEVWAEALDEDLERAIDPPEGGGDPDRLEAALDDGAIDDVRVVTHTRPAAVAGIPRKKPHLMETRVGGGDVADRLEHATELVEADEPVDVDGLFRPGEFLDVAAVTKGKGTQGPVKRWGVQKRKGKHARQGWRRRIGNLGPWNPSRVRSTVPQQGQMGYHQRTELNKRLLAIADDDTASVDGGYVNYGEVDGPHVLIEGSVPGPSKRLVRFRPAIRPSRQPRLDPEVRHVATTSNQG
ncbi:MAG: 50S ribosomal protein L3 [Halobacteriales archaeon]